MKCKISLKNGRPVVVGNLPHDVQLSQRQGLWCATQNALHVTLSENWAFIPNPPQRKRYAYKGWS